MEENTEQQYDLGFKEPIGNKIKDRKWKVELFFLKIRTNTLLKNPFVWILSFLTITLILIQKYYYDNFFSKIPKEIPLFQIKDNLEHRLVDSNILQIIMIVSALLTVVSIFLAIKTYYKFKILSFMILGNIFLSILIITIEYIRVFSIYIH